MVNEAQRRNTSVSDVLRLAWVGHQEQLTLQAQLKQQEARLFRRLFELQCAIDRLSSSERQEVIETVNARLK